MLVLLKTYRALNEEQKKLVDQKQISGQRRAEVWIDLFDNLGGLDSAVEKFRLFLIIGGVVLCIGSLIGSAAADLPVIAIIGIPLGILMIITWWSLKGGDLHDNLKGYVIPLLKVLKEDVSPGKKVVLDLKIMDPVIQKFYTGTENLKPFGRQRSKKVNTYFYPWLNLKMKFKDETIVGLKGTEEIKQFKIKSISSSGKSKSKTKYKTKSFMLVKMEFDKKRYKLSGKKINDPTMAKIEVLGDKIVYTAKLKRKYLDYGKPNAVMGSLNCMKVGFQLVKPIGNEV